MLTDAGPLIALLDSDDPDHEACVRVLKAARAPLLTVWPAFTEAMFLLRHAPEAQDDLWEMIALGGLRFAPLDEGDGPRMRELMHKYRDLPMDLADAALVRVAERQRQRRVFTLDRKHFAIYRPARLGRFALVP